eukprot:14334511-Alexandrium_andersonii.AAC.1
MQCYITETCEIAARLPCSEPGVRPQHAIENAIGEEMKSAMCAAQPRSSVDHGEHRAPMCERRTCA